MKASRLSRILPAAFAATLALGAATAACAQVSVMDGGYAYNVKVTTFRDIPFKTVVRQQYDYSCGSAALATLLHYHYGQASTEAEIFKAMYAAGDQAKIRKVGFSLLDMKRYLESKGYEADGYRVNLKQLEEAKSPSIAMIVIKDYKHFVVIKGVRNGKVLVGDPALGLKIYGEKDFAKMWNGIVFRIRDTKATPALYNRSEDWNPWGPTPLRDGFANASLSGFTRELPPLYQMSGFLDLDPYISGDLP